MNYDRYDPNLHECKDCGMLLPDRPEDIEAHICSPYTIERKLEAAFGPREPKEAPKFRVGQEVGAELIGTIDWQYVRTDGKIIYRVTDEEKGIHGYFLEAQLFKLQEDL